MKRSKNTRGTSEIKAFPFRLRYENAGFVDGTAYIKSTASFLARTSFGDIEIPSGTYSDGTSTPQLVWSFAGHPFSGYIESAFVHDYLYRKENGYNFTRKQADQILRELMLAQGYHISAHTFYAAVRTCGWRSYQDYTPDELAKLVQENQNS